MNYSARTFFALLSWHRYGRAAQSTLQLTLINISTLLSSQLPFRTPQALLTPHSLLPCTAYNATHQRC